MWITVLVMAIAVSIEPVRIGLTVLMLNRPRPRLQLLAFLGGAFAMGLTVGLVVLFVLGQRLSTNANFTAPRVQIVIGVVALSAALLLASNIPGRMFSRQPVVRAAVAGGAGLVAPPTPPSSSTRLSAGARRLLRGRSPWVAGVAGSAIALPSIDYLAVLAVIAASGAEPSTQAAALLTFNAVAFALVEIPLIGYLAAPDKTRALMSALHDWMRTRRRRDVAALLAVAGSVMIAAGMTGL